MNESKNLSLQQQQQYYSSSSLALSCYYYYYHFILLTTSHRRRCYSCNLCQQHITSSACNNGLYRRGQSLIAYVPNMSAPPTTDNTASTSSNELTPITVITGFLGAGKTTLVNYILKEQNDWKICVLENEFGEVSIDDGLVAESLDAPEDLITMDNGCVCCSVRGDLVRTLGQLAKRRTGTTKITIQQQERNKNE